MEFVWRKGKWYDSPFLGPIPALGRAAGEKVGEERGNPWEVEVRSQRRRALALIHSTAKEDKISSVNMDPLLERKQWEEFFQRVFYPYPVLMLDRVEVVEMEKSIKAVKWVTANEFYLRGHFPGEPILPGVLTLEGLVQSALLLVRESYIRGRLRCALEKVDRVRFKRAIVPGDKVDFTVQLTAKEGEIWKLKGKARVGEETAAEADLTLKVTFREVGFEI